MAEKWPTPNALAPTVEAIDAWRARQEPANGRFATEYAQYGVDIKTKASEWRCITERVFDSRGEVCYWTIKGEGSSNGCREYAIPASKIVQARGWIVE